jgi:hypothetical protein
MSGEISGSHSCHLLLAEPPTGRQKHYHNLMRMITFLLYGDKYLTGYYK